MAVRKLAPENMQPESFVLSQETEAFADNEIAKYPPGRQASAVIALLTKVQEQAGGWLPRKAIEAVAGKLVRSLAVAHVDQEHFELLEADTGEDSRVERQHFVVVLGRDLPVAELAGLAGRLHRWPGLALKDWVIAPCQH